MCCSKFFCVLGFILWVSASGIAIASEIPIQPEIKDTAVHRQGLQTITIPVIGYNTEKGFSFGAYNEITRYGESSLTEYIHRITIEGGYYTNKSGYFHLVFNSYQLLRNIQTTLSVSYLSDKILPFYGFNGYRSGYRPELPEAYYSHHRDLFRIVADFQGEIIPGVRWMGGLSYYHYDIGSSSLTRNSLYDLYVDTQLIRQEEKNGGDLIYLKAGVSYDTRNEVYDPSSGVFSEVLLSAATGTDRSRKDGHLKLTLVSRHYVNLWKKRLVLAFRLAYQGSLAGEAPFYVQNNIQTLNFIKSYNDGIGGALSVRGVLPNRIVGNGMAWGNAEFRFKIIPFRLMNKDCYLSINPFFDSGLVIQPYREKEMSLVASLLNPESNIPVKETIHCAVGVGLKAVMTNQFVISGEFGKAMDKRDGTYGVYFGLNYLF